ncbi:AF334834_1 chaperon [Olea europaea subsp. europaea]|uniref:AF334834_1 chaperon n=1 Tax=Olea europaea subsp. europaea TaxID=158383 RepID=A0A8S0TPB2_OLEEU|nr:AF334834_1 chaperon [Olea europaea subsp. europaea]
MANLICSVHPISFKTLDNTRLISGNFANRKVGWINDCTTSSRKANFEALKVKATDSKPSTKRNSIICTDCEGNGAVACSQCKGSGINSVDHFNGQFKAGTLCWLCRGKKEILCGNCNGAGFIGGFLSTHDD